MNASSGAAVARMVIRHELEALRGRWPWFLTIGILMIVFGTLALATPFIATGAAVLMIGILLMASGLTSAVGSFWSREWSGFLIGVLGGALYFVLGLLFVRRPAAAAAALTALIAGLLLAGGIIKIVFAASHRFPQWGWAALSGALSLALGLLIMNDYPASSIWVIGTFIGLELIFQGWFWVMLALALKRRIPAPASS